MANGSSEGRELAFKVRALLKGKTLVEEIAFHMSRGLQHYPQRADRADKTATDHHVLRNNVTLKLCILAEYKRQAMDVA